MTWIIATKDDTPWLYFLLPALIIGGQLVLHMRGWRHSSNALLVSTILMVVIGTPPSYMREHLTITALVPTVLAAVLFSPRWTISAFAGTMLGLAAHMALAISGPGGVVLGPTFDIVNLLILMIVTAGIATASAVARAAQHAAEAQAREAHAAARRADEALALLDTVLQSAPIGFAFVDRDLRYQLINPRLAALNGLPPAAHLGRTIQSLGHQRAATVTPILEQVLAQGEAVLDVEHVVSAATSESQHWLCSYYPVRTRDDALLGIGTVAFEISERKQAEQALRESEQRFRATFEQAPVGIAHIIPGGRLLRVNQHLCDILGYTRAELLQRTIYDIGGLELGQIARAGAPQLLAHEVSSVTLEEFFTRQDGASRWIDVTVSLMSDDNGAPDYFIAVVEDITARRQAEQALIAERALLAQRVQERTADLSAANAELARSARLKDEFLASMSHELRTPLNAVLGLTEALREQIYGPLTDRQARTLQTIEESGRHLLDLINDVLDLAKIGAGKLELALASTSVASICHSSLRMVQQAAQKKSIGVQLALDPAAEWVCADARRLKQILMNLLSNAVKFTQAGGKIGLEVTTNADRGAVIFTVWDTGIGIAPDQLEHVFQSFVQLDGRLARQYEGTGLGLALVARMTELHGGSVSVASTLGVGSRFSVALPADKRAPQDSAVPLASLPAAARAQPGTDADAAPGLPIVLAEDNEANIITVADYLTTIGYRVVVARNGEEAIARARDLHPALILMDIQMPVMDGLEATQRIRADPQLADIPIIALTALAMPGDRDRCLAAGANDYLSKPIGLKLLAATIVRHLAPAPAADS